MIWFVFEQSLSYLLMIPRNNFFRWNVISNFIKMFLALFSRQNLTRVQLKHNCIYVHVPLCSFFGNRFPKTCLFAGYSWCTDTPSELYFLRCTCISEEYKNSLYIMYFDTCKLPTNIKQSRGWYCLLLWRSPKVACRHVHFRQM